MKYVTSKLLQKWDISSELQLAKEAYLLYDEGHMTVYEDHMHFNYMQLNSKFG